MLAPTGAPSHAPTLAPDYDLYVYGSDTVDKCPANYERITDGTTCRAAATAKGYGSASGDYASGDYGTDSPSGCHYQVGMVFGSTIYFNLNMAGKDSYTRTAPLYKLLCGACPSLPFPSRNACIP
jgi:hypothetical protein